MTLEGAMTSAVMACLECTPSQLTKLLRKHPPALAALNRERAQAGLRQVH